MFVLTEDLLRRVRQRDMTGEALTASEIVLDHAGQSVGPGVFVRAAERWVLDHRRDPDADCDEFEPGPPSGQCWTDGHYMCRECKHLPSDEVRADELRRLRAVRAGKAV